jgi:hypothetical protein
MEHWISRIKTLNETVWEQKVQLPVLDAWLSNFSGEIDSKEKERHHALHLLQQFMYFGTVEVRELLRALFRDHFRYPISRRIRRTKNDTLDQELIHREFDSELKRTRFLGVGNPAESGTHLLYYFRQENNLPKELFCNTEQIFSFSPGIRPTIRDSSIKRYVFMDDFCGSGNQVKQYLSGMVSEIKEQQPDCEVWYLVLFATERGLASVSAAKVFDVVDSVVPLGKMYRCFDPTSIYFSDAVDSNIDKAFSYQLFTHYGKKLCGGAPLGYGDCQLIIGFCHNTPDNTLPTVWMERNSPFWRPAFPRFHKTAYNPWSL